MCELIEPCVRRLVADQLERRAGRPASPGGTVERLSEDPALLLDVALALEARFGITISEPALARVDTYGDLVRLTIGLVVERERVAGGPGEAVPAVCVRASLRSGGRPALERVFILTPYAAQTIVEDAMRLGRDGALDVVVPEDTADDALSSVERALARPRTAGVRVLVRRDGTIPPPPAAGTTAAEIAVLIGRLLHETQNERELGAAHLASRGDDFRDAVLAQRAETDRTLGDLRALIGSHPDGLAPIARMHADAVIRLLEQLETARDDIVGRRREVGEVIEYYTQVNTELLAAADALMAAASETEMVRIATAHLAFLHAKEEAALERAEMARALAPGGHVGRQALLASCIAARESYLRTFATTAAEDVLHAYRECVADPSFAETARLEQAMLERPSRGVDRAACFRVMTAKLEHLRHIEDRSAAMLLRQSGAQGH